MNRTSRSSSDVRIAARSPARSIAGPEVVLDVDPELAGDDRRERRLAEAGRAVQQDVVGGLSPALRRGQQHGQVGLDLALADVLVEGPRSKGAFDDEVALVLEIRREDAREVVGHPAKSSTRQPNRTDVRHANTHYPTRHSGLRYGDALVPPLRVRPAGPGRPGPSPRRRPRRPGDAGPAQSPADEVPRADHGDAQARRHRQDDARVARRLRPGGRSDDGVGRAGHPAARWRPGAPRVRLAALLRAVLVRWTRRPVRCAT